MAHEPEKRMPDEHPNAAYATALAALRAAKVPHVVGGGLAIQHYGRRRSTKDLDLFIRPQDVEVALNALAAAGFTTMDTDAAWLRKAVRADAHIDLIVYSMGSIALTDDEIERSLSVELDGVPMQVFRPEDLLVRKIYLLRDEGPDWHDAFSILESEGTKLNWGMVERDALDPRPLAGFLLVADARAPGFIPPHILARHLRRAGLYYDQYAQLHLPESAGASSGGAAGPPESEVGPSAMAAGRPENEVGSSGTETRPSDREKGQRASEAGPVSDRGGIT